MLLFILIIGCVKNNSQRDTTNKDNLGHDHLEKEEMNLGAKKLDSYDIEKVHELVYRVLKYKDDSTRLVELICELDTLLINQERVSNDFIPFLHDLVLINLDEDISKELVLFYGRFGPEHGRLVVFKNIAAKWRVIFDEDFSHQYSGVELDIKELKDHKILTVSNLEQRGSGVHKTGKYFFRVVDNKLKLVLRILEEGRLHGWAVPLNQEITSTYNIKKDGNIEVEYIYNFYPGPLLEGDVSWIGHPEIPFVTGNSRIVYGWDEGAQEYMLDNLEDQRKVLLFDDYGNDSLFIAIYQAELMKNLRSKDTLRVKLTRNFLDIIEGKRPLGLKH